MKTKIILEIGYNHQGDIEIAKHLIDEAKKLKVWGVKFQKWSIEEFPENIKKQIRNDENSFGKNYYEHRKFLEFSIDQLKELKEYSNEKGLKFVCSGKDFTAIKQLVNMGCQYIKLPSQRYKTHDIFKYLTKNKKGYKILVSCGMNNGQEIYKSRWVELADVLFYCISLYPAKINEIDFETMRKLFTYRQYKYKGICGYSSHEEKGDGIKYAVLLGADYIERHFTLDKTMKGSDHKISSDPEEMKKIIKDIKEIEKLLGTGNRQLTKEELKLREYYWSF